MTAPAVTLTITQRSNLQMLKLEERQVVPPGRVMLCKGGKIVGYRNLDQLGEYGLHDRCTALCFAPADYDDVKRWLA